MNNKKIFFIGGIHGVGKGTICGKISDRININSIAASSLLKWKEVPESVDHNKKVNDIPDTQNRLLNGINQLNEGIYLVDGHFCLLDSDEKIVGVPFEIFNAMNPINLALIVQEPRIIAKRLYLRDGLDYDVNLISDMQETEITHAKMISDKLKIQLFIIENEDIELYVNEIKRLIKN